MAQCRKTGQFVALDHYGKCPECHADWDAGAVFDVLRTQDWCADKTDEQLREHVQQCYSPPYRFSRLIGIEVRGYYDGVSRWRCPDCSAEWDRFSNKRIANGKTR